MIIPPGRDDEDIIFTYTQTNTHALSLTGDCAALSGPHCGRNVFQSLYTDAASVF